MRLPLDQRAMWLAMAIAGFFVWSGCSEQAPASDQGGLECRLNSDCAQGQVCDPEGVCIEAPPCSGSECPCSVQGDCGEGQRCDVPTGACVAAECGSDLECGLGSVCALGVCVTDLGADRDRDGVPDNEDNCADLSNPEQEDPDFDAVGSACDADDDNDRVPDGEDNCALSFNPEQFDADGDGEGNACDADWRGITVSGRITTDDLLEFAPEEARVTLSANRAIVSPDAEGFFTFPDALLQGGSHVVEVSWEGFVPSALAFVASPAEAVVDVGVIDMRALASDAEQAVRLFGEVSLEDGGSPLGIQVTVNRDNGDLFAVVSTDAEGRYALDVAPLDHTLFFARAGYRSQNAVPAEFIAPESRFEVNGGAPVVLEPNPGTVTGGVLKEGAEDHRGIVVTLNGTANTASTGQDGGFVLSDVPEGIYSLSAQAEGFERVDFPLVSVRAGQSVDVGSATLALKTGRIEGLVTAGERSVLGARVELVGVPVETVVDADGRFALDAPLGNYNGVRVSLDNFVPLQTDETITVTENGVASAGLIALVQRSNDVVGQVELTGRDDASGVLVEIFEDGQVIASHTLVTPSGDFRLAGLPLGAYDVRFSFPVEPGWSTVRRAIVLGAGPDLRLFPETLIQRAIFINDDAPVTTNPTVRLGLTAPGCSSMRYANQAALGGAVDGTCLLSPPQLNAFQALPFGDCRAVVQDHLLSPLDGPKCVAVQFRVGQEDGDIIADGIVLDTRAEILSLEVEAPAPAGLGDTIHFALDAGEPGGRASVSILGYAQDIGLSDDGTLGDLEAGDGIYERDFTVVQGRDVVGANLVGTFTDAPGNEAEPFVVEAALEIAIPPVIVGVDVLSNALDGEATLTWTTDEQTTGRASLGDSEFDLDRLQVTGLQTAHSATFDGLTPGVRYFFQIETTDRADNTTSTTTRSFLLAPNPPEAVVGIGGDGRVDVRWAAPPVSQVAGYRIYRGPSQNGPFEQISGDTTRSPGLVFSDQGVANGQTRFYAVSAVDDLGNESALSEIVQTTARANNGGTDVCGGGPVVGGQIWSTSGSPYTVDCNLLVRSGTRLVVGAGVEVRFAPGTGILVEGQLVVVGQPDAEVILQPTIEAQGWDGIAFVNSRPTDFDITSEVYERGNLIHAALLRRAAGSPAISVRDASVAVIDSTVRESSRALTFEHAQFLGLRMAIEDNTTPIQEALISGLSGVGQRINFIDSAIERNQNESADSTALMRFRLGDPNPNDNLIRFKGGVIADNHTIASLIDLDEFNAEVVGVEFSNNNTSGQLIKAFVLPLVVYGCRFTGNTGGIFTADIQDGFPNNPLNPGLVVISNNIFEGGNSSADSDADFSQFTAERVTAQDGSAMVLWEWGDYHVFANRFSGYGQGRQAVGTVIRSEFFPFEFNGPSRFVSNHFEGNMDAAAMGVFTFEQGDFTFEGNNIIAAPDRAAMANFTAIESGDLPASNNHWGPSATEEMARLGLDANIGDLFDVFDDIAYSAIDYSGFRLGAFPIPHTLAPLFGDTFDTGSTVTLSGTADDTEDGALPPEALSWSSDLDGPLGQGSPLALSNLSPGSHRITLTATDSDGQTGRVWFLLRIRP